MWFDAQQALAAIEGGTPDTVRLPQPEFKTPARVAQVARVARTQCPNHELTPSAGKPTNPSPYGESVAGNPVTWTGCIVSLAAWRILTEWEKHGPNGRHWNGITKQWEQSKGKLND
jgi:hypothetical protein